MPQERSQEQSQEQSNEVEEQSLDPDNWEELRQLGHRAFDDMIEYLQTIRDRPACQPLPAAARQLFDEGVPRQSTPHDEVYAQIHEHKGFAPIVIGLGPTLIHLISIPVTNTSVNPARSTGVGLYVGDWAVSQLCLFLVAPIVGAVIGAFVYRYIGGEQK